MPQRLIIDTDIGDDIDDALAIAFAILRPELKVEAITTVAGHTDKRARIVQRLLDSAGQGGIPVAAGLREPPFTQTPQMRDRYFNMSCPWCLNQYPYVLDDGAAEGPVPENAIELIIELARRKPGELGLACIGPLTNIAAALQRAPDLKEKLKFIAIMGGETFLNRIEYNINCDPISAAVVFSSGVRLFVGTWDVTRRFVIDEAQCAAIRRVPTKLCAGLGRLLDLWWPCKGGKPGPVMYDIAPIIWSFAPDSPYYKTERAHVAIETKGEHTFGMTVRKWDAAPNVELTTDMDAAAVSKLFMETLCKD